VVKSILALASAILMAACSAHVATTTQPAPTPPTLSRDQAQQLMLRADDIRRQALEFPGTANFAEAFGGIAFRRLRALSDRLSMQGMSEEERSSSRDLVFWDPLADEAVLEVAAERRIVSPDQPNPPWSSTARQWWARLQNVGGNWLVVDDQDLTPDRWR
jgi:hypothetical protein